MKTARSSRSAPITPLVRARGRIVVRIRRISCASAISSRVQEGLQLVNGHVEALRGEQAPDEPGRRGRGSLLGRPLLRPAPAALGESFRPDREKNWRSSPPTRTRATGRVPDIGNQSDSSKTSDRRGLFPFWSFTTVIGANVSQKSRSCPLRSRRMRASPTRLPTRLRPSSSRRSRGQVGGSIRQEPSIPSSLRAW